VLVVLKHDGDRKTETVIWTGTETHAPSRETEGRTMSQEWYYAKGDQKKGPITSQELTALAKSGELKPPDLVWTEGMADWEQAGSVSGLFPPERSRSGPPPIPTRPQKVTPAERQETVSTSSVGQASDQLRMLQASLSSATTAAAEKIRRMQDHQVMKDAKHLALSVKEDFAQNREVAGLPTSEWKQIALLTGVAALAALIGLVSPFVAGVFLLCSIWAYRDAGLRGNAALKWSVATVLLGPLTLPFYLSSRNLREGEVREGGRAWNVLKHFAIYWTATIAIATLSGLSGVSDTAAQASSDAEKAGVAIGATIGLGLMFFLWFLPFVGSVLLGLLLKKSAIVERGPTIEGMESPVHLATKPFLIAGAVGFLVVMVAGGFHSSTESRPSSFASSAVSREGPSASPPAARNELKLGDEFKLGNFKYRILSTDRRRAVGNNEFFRTAASSGATFFVVSYTIENCSNESQTVMAEDFVLLDSSGRKFQPSTKASTALLAGDDHDFLVSQLQPGIPRSMKTAFEVPNSAANSEMTLIIPEKGFWGRGEARVKIGNR
jgi:hypothetical protein